MNRIPIGAEMLAALAPIREAPKQPHHNDRAKIESVTLETAREIVKKKYGNGASLTLRPAGTDPDTLRPAARWVIGWYKGTGPGRRFYSVASGRRWVDALMAAGLGR